MATDVDIVDAEVEEIGTELELRQPTSLNLFRTNDPGEVIVKAAATAKPLAEVIRKQKLYKTIQGKNHVFVEGWTLLGSMLGVFPIVVWTKPVEGGWEARVEARTMAGVVVGAAEAQCLRKESRWGSADDYAIRSMAQTRATSRALRGPLGFVVQLAGFQPEPAEDMPEPPEPKKRGGRKSAGEPGASRREDGAAGETAATAEPPASPAESPPQGQSTTEGVAQGQGDAERGSSAEESHFKAPTGPRGGQATALEAQELEKELVALCERIGAVDSIPMVKQKAEAGDVAWLKRQIASASRALARQEQGE